MPPFDYKRPLTIVNDILEINKLSVFEIRTNILRRAWLYFGNATTTDLVRGMTLRYGLLWSSTLSIIVPPNDFAIEVENLQGMKTSISSGKCLRDISS